MTPRFRRAATIVVLIAVVAVVLVSALGSAFR